MFTYVSLIDFDIGGQTDEIRLETTIDLAHKQQSTYVT